LLGREREVAQLCALLRGGARLVTLTGPGGTGKTRLGLQVAAELLDVVEHGTYLVLLAPIGDPTLVAPTIVQTLGAPDAGGTPPLDVLKAYLREREMILLLDNFEQILPAATDIAELLAACPRLTVLVTSRAPLQIGGEHEYPVPPLDLPDRTCPLTADELARNPAVALFVERASAIKPDFALTETNATAIAQICARLDGLPLAIELAAARSRLLSPDAMLPRLGRSLALLTGGRRDLPARQRTLRDAIAWSYRLLPEGERRLFQRLSVFVGGFTLEAAEAIVNVDGRPGVEVQDGLETLIAYSLVRASAPGDGGDSRFTMLETIRELGAELLDGSGEQSTLRERHLDWYVGLGDQFLRAVDTPAYSAWLVRFESENDNLRAALRWSADPACEPTRGLRLAGRLREYWSIRGMATEGRAWSGRLLARSAARTEARALALGTAGYLAARQNDFPAAEAVLEEALSIWRELGEERGIAQALRHLALTHHHRREFDRARALLEESLSMLDRIHDQRADAMTRRYLADLLFDSGAFADAVPLYERCLAGAQERDSAHEIGYALRGLGNVARAQGDYVRARALFRESVGKLASLNDLRCTPICLEGLACTETGPNWSQRAARLLGAANAFQATTGQPAPPAEMADYQRTEADARAHLGGDRFRAAWQAGAAMSLDEAVAYALAEDEAPPSDRAQRQDEVPLSAREREVVALIADGLSNRQIADRLVLSVRTVERHIENVYNRLGISGKAGRAIVTAYALRHGLVPAVA
jgi:non-specific serine/threonine protein kinase